eukprot:CAMPEP_0119540142 /NCGR_PEP_ID=MMETSP1344-20130328/52108_1 /TAXON_ID=236787 /ORGANISM="Florenciella parvula, Strain CCMP2471" /LENGTH=60 /DNA_ID=CAMNT_0007583749 /DNA_START=116 /DNA_END=298 /DNA_ORIENTATION=-
MEPCEERVGFARVEVAWWFPEFCSSLGVGEWSMAKRTAKRKGFSPGLRALVTGYNPPPGR